MMKRHLLPCLVVVILAAYASPGLARPGGDPDNRLKDKHDNRAHHKRVHVVRKPTYFVGHTVNQIPGTSISLSVGNRHVWFHLGTFFEHYERGYRVVRAPVGLSMITLPPGYRRMVIGGNTYFYLEGNYYLYDGRLNHYVVVEPPNVINEPVVYDGEYHPGEVYSRLPLGARPIEINGIQYFKYQTLYFLPQVIDGEVSYLALRLD